MDFCDPFRFLWSLFSVFLCVICQKVQCLEGFSFELMHWYGCVSDLNKCSDIKNENKYLFFDWLESKEIRLECDCRDALPPNRVRPKSRVRSRKQNPMGARILSVLEGIPRPQSGLTKPDLVSLNQSTSAIHCWKALFMLVLRYFNVKAIALLVLA